MIVSTGLTVPVAVAVRAMAPRAAGTVTYCAAFFPPSAHSQKAMPAMIASEPKAAASQNFRAPGPFMCAALGDSGNFSTLPRASTGDASELTLIVVSRIGGANGGFFATSLSAFAEPFGQSRQSSRCRLALSWPEPAERILIWVNGGRRMSRGQAPLPSPGRPELIAVKLTGIKRSTCRRAISSRFARCPLDPPQCGAAA